MTALNDNSNATLDAERAIHRTYLHYFWLCNHHEWDRVAGECFAPNGAATYRPLAGEPFTLSGRDEIHEFYRANFDDPAETSLQRIVYVVGDTFIDWDSGAPTVKGAVTAWRWL